MRDELSSSFSHRQARFPRSPYLPNMDSDVLVVVWDDVGAFGNDTTCLFTTSLALSFGTAFFDWLDALYNGISLKI